MKIQEILARPRGYQIWGASHSGSKAITGRAAKWMDVPGYKAEEDPPPQIKSAAYGFLEAIAQSPGSPEPLAHGFQNIHHLDYRVGEIISLPLTATTGGGPDKAVGYGLKMDPKYQFGEPTVYLFPAGTPFAGYDRWNKADAAEFGYTWDEALVAGKFKVTGMEKRKQYGWDRMPEYTIVHLVQVAVFNPLNRQWTPLQAA